MRPKEGKSSLHFTSLSFALPLSLSGQPLQPGGMSAAGVNQENKDYIYSYDNNPQITKTRPTFFVFAVGDSFDLLHIISSVRSESNTQERKQGFV